MNRAIIYLCAFVFAFSQTVLASDAKTILHLNDDSCGDWVESRQKNQTAIQLWYLGFISGINFRDKNDLLSRINAASAYLWMDKYCRENPLKTVVQGSVKLLDELKPN